MAGLWRELFPDVTPDLSYREAAGEVVRTLFWDGHHVAALIGSRAPLDALGGQARAIERVGEGPGTERALREALDRLVAATHEAIPLIIDELEELSDQVDDAMDAFAAQDAATATRLASLSGDLEDET